MSGHRNARITHDKFIQTAQNLEAANEKIKMLTSDIEIKNLALKQKDRAIKFYAHDFRWLITLSICFGTSMGWIARGLVL